MTVTIQESIFRCARCNVPIDADDFCIWCNCGKNCHCLCELLEENNTKPARFENPKVYQKERNTLLDILLTNQVDILEKKSKPFTYKILLDQYIDLDKEEFDYLLTQLRNEGLIYFPTPKTLALFIGCEQCGKLATKILDQGRFPAEYYCAKHYHEVMQEEDWI